MSTLSKSILPYYHKTWAHRCSGTEMRCSLAVRTTGFPPGDPGSTPGSARESFSFFIVNGASKGDLNESIKFCPKQPKNRNAPSEPIKLHLVRYRGTVVWRLEKWSLPDENEVYKGPTADALEPENWEFHYHLRSWTLVSRLQRRDLQYGLAL